MCLFHFLITMTLILSTESNVIQRQKDSEFPTIPIQKKAYSLSFDLLIYEDFVTKGSDQNRTILYMSPEGNNEIRSPEVSLLPDNKLRVCSSPLESKRFCYHSNNSLPYGKTIKIKIEQTVKPGKPSICSWNLLFSDVMKPPNGFHSILFVVRLLYMLWAPLESFRILGLMLIFQ